MRKIDIVVIFVRLLGIYFTISGLGDLPLTISYLASFFSETPIGVVVIGSIAPAFYIIAGVVLFLKAPKLGKFVIDFSLCENDEQKESNFEENARIALLVLGIYLFSNTIPSFIQIVIDAQKMVTQADLLDKIPGVSVELLAYSAGPIITLLISAALIMGSDKVLSYIFWYDSKSSQTQNVGKNEKLFGNANYLAKMKITLLAVGLYIFATSLPEVIESAGLVVSRIIRAYSFSSDFRGTNFVAPTASLIGSFIKLIISIVLIFGLDKVRGRGVYPKTSSLIFQVDLFSL